MASPQFGTRFWEVMKDGATRLNAAYFNPIWRLIDTRLVELENTKADYEAEAEKFTTIGLQRLDQVLGPSFERLGRIAELGFLIAHSSTAETLVLDEVSTFVVQDLDERDLFHASAWVTLARVGVSNQFALGQVLSYTRSTGVLDVMIKQIVGISGSHSDWEIITGTGVTLYMQTIADQVLADRITTVTAKNAALQAALDVAAAVILIQGGPVSTVNGQGGTVVLNAASVGAMSSADGTALATSLTNAVNAALAAQSAANATALAAKEKLWAAPAAYNSGIALDHQHISVTSSLTLNLITTASAVGDRFRITMRGTSGFTATLNGSGVRFRNAAGTFVTEAFTVDLINVTHEFVKVATTDWELI